MTTSTTATPIVALYLDAWLSSPAMIQVIERCRDLGAHLLCLAPRPGKIAVSRIEPHLRELERARIHWSVRACEDDLETELDALPALAQLICTDNSALARHPGSLPAPLVILCNPPAPVRQPADEPAPAIDWLAPRLHRGF